MIFSALLLISFALSQCAIGGTRLLFSLPSFGILALAALLTIWTTARVRTAPSRTCLAATAILFGYVLVRAAASPVAYLWWPDFYLVLACLAVYLLTALHLKRTRDRLLVVCGLLALALAQVLIGLQQFSRADNWMPFNIIRPDSGARASGMFISSIHLAGFLEIAAAFALSLAFWSSWKGWARFLAGYLALICYVGIAITGSRGGYASAVASALVFVAISLAALRRARPARFRGALIASSLGLFIILGGGTALVQKSAMLKQRLALIGKPDVRIYNWQAALDQFATSPFFGTGAGTHLYFGRFFRRPEIQTDPVHAHSDYLELLAEYGAAGFAGLLAFLAAHFRSGLRSLAYLARSRLALHAHRGDNVFALRLGALTACAAHLVHSAVDFNMHIPANALVIAFVFGVLAHPASGESDAQPGIVTNVAAWSLPAVGLALAFCGLPKLPGEYWCERARVALRDRHYPQALDFGARGLAHERRNPDLYFHIGEANRAMAANISVRALRKPLLETAVAAYRDGLKLFPQDENLWIRLGQALDDLKKFDEAETSYLTAIALDPNLGVLYLYYAAHLNARGRLEEAGVQLAKARSLGATPALPDTENRAKE